MMGRFGRGFGGPWSEGDWEGWTPPWMRGGPGFRGPRFGRHFRGPWGPWGGPWEHEEHRRRWHGPTPEQQALFSTAAEVARLFMIAGRSAADNPERQAQLRGFLERARAELSDIIYSSGQGGTAPDSGSTDAPNVEKA